MEELSGTQIELPGEFPPEQAGPFDMLRAEKWQADDGTMICTIWYPSQADPEVGCCFDFREADIDELIRHLQALKES
jgi:hypothetical protein